MLLKEDTSNEFKSNTSIKRRENSQRCDEAYLGRQIEKWCPHKNKQIGEEKQPCIYCRHSSKRDKRRNCPAYGKYCMECRKLNHFHTKSKNLNKSNQRTQGTSEASGAPLKKILTAQRILRTSISAKP